MTSRMIYHDFQSNTPVSTMTEPVPTTALTAHVLAKGRRRAKLLAGIDTAVKVACIALNAVCTGVGLYVIFYIMTAGM